MHCRHAGARATAFRHPASLPEDSARTSLKQAVHAASLLKPAFYTLQRAFLSFCCGFSTRQTTVRAPLLRREQKLLVARCTPPSLVLPNFYLFWASWVCVVNSRGAGFW